jgi:hypothetical protein
MDDENGGKGVSRAGRQIEGLVVGGCREETIYSEQ